MGDLYSMENIDGIDHLVAAGMAIPRFELDSVAFSIKRNNKPGNVIFDPDYETGYISISLDPYRFLSLKETELMLFERSRIYQFNSRFEISMVDGLYGAYQTDKVAKFPITCIHDGKGIREDVFHYLNDQFNTKTF